MGFLLRLSELNGYQSPRWLLDALKLPQALASTPADLSLMANTLGVTVPALERLCFWPVASPSNERRFGSGTLSLTGMSLGVSKLCPDCVLEDGIIRRVWSMSAYVACHKHGRRMIEECRLCGRILRWDRRSLLKCPCGSEFKPDDEEMSPAVISTCAALYQIDNEGAISPGMSLSVANRVIRFFGRDQAMQNWVGSSTRKSRDDFLDYVGSTSEYFSSWKSALHKWCEANLPATRSSDLGAAHTKILWRIRANFGRSECRWILNDIKDILSKTWQKSARNSRIWFFDSIDNPEYVSRKEAAAALRIASADVPALLTSEALEGYINGKNGRKFCYISRKSLEDRLGYVSELRKNYVSIKDGVRCFKCSANTVRYLMRAGNISFKTIGNYKRYKKDELDEFLAKLCGDGLPIAAITQYVPLRSLTRISFAKALKRLCSGDLESFHFRKSPNRLDDIYISKRDYNKLVSDHRNEVSGDAYLAKTGFVRMPGMTQATVRHLQETCFDKLCAFFSTRNGAVIMPREQAAAFDRLYCTSVSAARDYGVSARSLAVRLRHHSIAPVIAANSRSNIKPIWLRKDIEVLFGARGSLIQK